MKSAIRKRLKDFLAIVGIVVLAVGVGGYILLHERLRFPFVQPSRFELKAAFTTAQAVTPGQGQTVNVAGVPIGEISTVDLVDGRAVVTLSIDPEYKGFIRQNASALLRPRTGLKDMFVQLDPGSRSAPAATPGWTIPVRNTLPDINPDEVFSALDADTRAYLKLLIGGAAQGLRGEGADLRDVFRRFEPTHRDLARFTTAVAARRRDLSQLINSLNRLNAELATNHTDLSQLVASSSTVFRAFASENGNISQAIRNFPAALRQTTVTLGKVQRFADVLGPASERLRPAVRALTRANLAVRPFVREAAPIIRDQIRPFVRAARPVVRDLRPAARRLATATPNLRGSFQVLNHLFNMLGYNPGGREDPNLPGRSEGYLFWIAWVTHQTVNLFSLSDANGPLRPVELAGTCQTFTALKGLNPLVAAPGVLDLVTNSTICNKAVTSGVTSIIPTLPPLPKTGR